jgi:ubiquitin-protein ligase
MIFKLNIHFPANYPMSPPVIRFESPCYHPNVDLTSGAICLDILQASVVTYSPSMSPNSLVLPGQVVRRLLRADHPAVTSITPRRHASFSITNSPH